MTGPIAMGGSKITGAADPTDAQDVATKKYVDEHEGDFLPLAGGTMTGPIAMGGSKITGAADPMDAQDVATKKYVDEHGGDFLPLAGGTMTGNIDMDGRTIINLADATKDGDAVSKKYMENALDNYLHTSGGTMNGAINMGGNIIHNVSNPVNNGDAANKEYADQQSTKMWSYFDTIEVNPGTRDIYDFHIPPGDWFVHVFVDFNTAGNFDEHYVIEVDKGDTILIGNFINSENYFAETANNCFIASSDNYSLKFGSSTVFNSSYNMKLYITALNITGNWTNEPGHLYPT